MAAKGNTRRVLSPVFVLGATSFAIVAGVGMARYALADQQPQTATITTKATSTTSVAPVADTPTETSVSSPPAGNDNSKSTTSPDNTSGSSHASVTVNGETYTVQDSGQLHTTTIDNSGQTSIDISVQSSGSGQQYSSASSHVHVFSNSFNTSQSNRSTTP